MMEEALKTLAVRPGYKKTKLGWIPDDWSETYLNDLGNFLKGKGVPKKEICSQGIPCLTYGELYKYHHEYIKSFKSFIPEEVAEEGTELRKGDILFAGSGETLEEIGKSAAFLDDFRAFAGGDIVILRQEKAISMFLGYLLNGSVVRKQLNRIGQGNSVVHVYPKGLGKIKIPLPPLPEQRKIAEILSTWDRAIDALTKLIEKKKERKKGLMYRLLKGKVRLAKFTESWYDLPIQEFARVIRGASPRPKGDNRYYGGRVPRLMVEDVTRDGRYVTPTTDFLTELGATKSRPCKAGTLTVVCSGDVGTPSFLAVDACIHDGFLGIIEINPFVDENYLYSQLLLLKDRLERSATHGGVFTNLTTQILKEFKIPIPPKQEQIEIAATLDLADQEIQKLEGQLKKLEVQKKGLMQKLLTGEIRVRKNST